MDRLRFEEELGLDLRDQVPCVELECDVNVQNGVKSETNKQKSYGCSLDRSAEPRLLPFIFL